jgi:uncharacterized sulfatase
MSSDSLTRRRLLRTGAAALAASRLRSAEIRPNILWLIGEDLCPDLHCYGNPAIRTPNLDRLAAEGMRFDNAYVTGPICSPSRSAIATGMWQIAIDAQHHRSHRTDGHGLPEGIHHFSHYLRRAGYHTSNVVTAAPGVRGTNKTDYDFTTSEKPFDAVDWSRRAPGQPFYAQINFSEAHRTWRRDPVNPVDPATVKVPPYYPDVPAVREDWAMYYDSIQQLDTAIGKVLRRLEEENLLDNTVIAFFGDNGRAMPRGKEFLYEGGIHTPFIVRLPERLRIEGGGRGVVRQDLVSCIDLTVTTLELAGVKPPAHMHGVPFLGPNRRQRGFVFAARDRCDETPDRIRSVRDRRFKYIRNYHPEIPYTAANVDRDVEIPTLRVMRQMHEKGQLNEIQARFMADRKPPEELFDLQSDPHETHNLASSQTHREILQKLRTELDRWVEDMHDCGARAEDPKAMQTPQEIEYRKQVEGWCTHNYDATRVVRTPNSMQVKCSGKKNLLRRSYVTEGGELELRFSAKSNGAPPKTFSWGAITDIDNPTNSVPVQLPADGQRHECRIPFRVTGHLAIMSFDFGAAEGATDFDWISLHRGNKQEAVWTFI